MTTAPWSGPRGLRGLRGRGVTRPAPGRGTRPSRTAAPSLSALRPADWGRAVGCVAGAGMRSARGYVSTCSHKAFALLCVLIVVAAMVASLVFNTARGEGAFHLAEAQSSHRQATETRLSVEAQVDEMSSPEQLSARAEQLGMVPAGTMGYVDPETGAVLGEAEAAPQAPASAADNGAGNGAGGAPADESDEKDDKGEESNQAKKDEPAKKKPAEKKPAKKADDEPTAQPSQKSTPASD
ncbi:hypothetical protein [Kytococcus sedentarius]|uniref:hypothetical protein n=1 Tax=Kytococcus sedentarius TaxID=1276 RepID=UPI000DFFA8D4|nr:hypothetical protein [Kytococcus sedentarius]STX14507.1 Uncharacterised protein [Kytococcus sedentarius]